MSLNDTLTNYLVDYETEANAKLQIASMIAEIIRDANLKKNKQLFYFYCDISSNLSIRDSIVSPCAEEALLKYDVENDVTTYIYESTTLAVNDIFNTNSDGTIKADVKNLAFKTYDDFLAEYCSSLLNSIRQGQDISNNTSKFILSIALSGDGTNLKSSLFLSVPDVKASEEEPTISKIENLKNTFETALTSYFESASKSIRGATSSLDDTVNSISGDIRSFQSEDIFEKIENDIEKVFKSKTEGFTENESIAQTKKNLEEYMNAMSDAGLISREKDILEKSVKITYCGKPVDSNTFLNETKNAVSIKEPDFRVMMYLSCLNTSSSENQFKNLNKLNVGTNNMSGESYETIYASITEGYFKKISQLIDNNELKPTLEAIRISAINATLPEDLFPKQGYISKNAKTGQEPLYASDATLVEVEIPRSAKNGSLIAKAAFDPFSLNPQLIIGNEGLANLLSDSPAVGNDELNESKDPINKTLEILLKVSSEDDPSQKGKAEIDSIMGRCLISIFYFWHMFPDERFREDKKIIDSINKIKLIVNAKYDHFSDGRRAKLATIFKSDFYKTEEGQSDATSILSFIENIDFQKELTEEQKSSAWWQIFDNAFKSMSDLFDMINWKSSSIVNNFKNIKKMWDTSLDMVNMQIGMISLENRLKQIGFNEDGAKALSLFYGAKKGYAHGYSKGPLEIVYSEKERLEESVIRKYIRKILKENKSILLENLNSSEQNKLKKLTPAIVKNGIDSLEKSNFSAAFKNKNGKTDYPGYKAAIDLAAAKGANVTEMTNANAASFKSFLQSENSGPQRGKYVAYYNANITSAPPPAQPAQPAPQGGQGSGGQGTGGSANQGGSGPVGPMAGETQAEGTTTGSQEYRAAEIKPVPPRSPSQVTITVEQQIKRLKEYEAITRNPSVKPDIDTWILTVWDEKDWREWMQKYSGERFTPLAPNEGGPKSNLQKLKTNNGKPQYGSGVTTIRNGWSRAAWEKYGAKYLNDSGFKEYHDLDIYTDKIENWGGGALEEPPINDDDAEDEADVVGDEGGGEAEETANEDSDAGVTADLTNLNEKQAEVRFGRCGTFVSASVIIGPIERSVEETEETPVEETIMKEARRKIRSFILKNHRDSLKKSIKEAIDNSDADDEVAGGIGSFDSGVNAALPGLKLLVQKAGKEASGALSSSEESSEETSTENFTREQAIGNLADNIANAINDDEDIVIKRDTTQAEIGTIINVAVGVALDAIEGLENRKQVESRLRQKVADELVSKVNRTKRNDVIEIAEAYKTAADALGQDNISATEGEESVIEGNITLASKYENVEGIRAVVAEICSPDYFGNTGWVTFSSFDAPGKILYAVCVYDPSGQYEGQAYPTAHNIGETKIATMYADIQSKLGGTNKDLMDLAMKGVLSGDITAVGFDFKGKKGQQWNETTDKDSLGSLSYLDFAKRIRVGDFNDELLKKNITDMNVLLKGRNIIVGEELVEAGGRLDGIDQKDSTIINLKEKSPNIYSKLIEELIAIFSSMRSGESFDFAAVERLVGNKTTYRFISKDKEKQEKMNKNVTLSRLFERVFRDKAFEFTGEQTRKDVRQDVSKMFSEYETNYEQMVADYKEIAAQEENKTTSEIDQEIKNSKDEMLRDKNKENLAHFNDSDFKGLENKDLRLDLAKRTGNPAFIGIHSKNDLKVNRLPRPLNDKEFKKALQQYYNVEGFKGAFRGLGNRFKRDSVNKEEDIGRKVLMKFTYFPSMDITDIYEKIIRKMIIRAGGNSSSAAGVDDEDVVTLSENKRIERLYLKSMLRESVKNIKKEVVKKKLKKSLIGAFLFEDVDISLDDYESSISALKRAKKNKGKLFKGKEEEEIETPDAVETEEEDEAAEEDVDAPSEVSGKTFPFSFDTSTGPDVATLSVIKKECVKGTLFSAKNRAEAELEKAGNPLDVKLNRLKKYYKAGGSNNPASEAAKAMMSDYTLASFVDKKFWSAAFISYCMEDYKPIGFEPSMTHTVFAKKAYNNRDVFGSTETPDDGLVMFFKDEGIEPQPGDIVFYLRDSNNNAKTLEETRNWFESNKDNADTHPSHSDIYIGNDRCIGGNLSNSVKAVDADKYVAIITRAKKKQ